MFLYLRPGGWYTFIDVNVSDACNIYLGENYPTTYRTYTIMVPPVHAIMAQNGTLYAKRLCKVDLKVTTMVVS